MSSIRRKEVKRRKKEWYVIFSPPYFNEVAVGSTLTDDPQKLIGRTLETTLFDITNDFSHQYVQIYFKVIDVKGENAHTMFKGHEYMRDYLRSLVRRHSSRVNAILDVRTRDNYLLRVYGIAFTLGRIQTSCKSDIRKAISEIISKKAISLSFKELAPELVFPESQLKSEIRDKVKKITAVRHVDIYKSKLLAMPKPRS